MDWKEIAGKVIAAGAPTLGQMLGDALPIPFGGSMGRWAGEYLATLLGVPPTPDAVSTAIDDATPTQISDVMARAEAEAVAKWQALAEMAKAQAEVGKAQVEQVNESIRAETAAGDGWWGKWRAAHAWELTLECPFWAACFMYAIIFGGGTPVNELAQASGILIVWFSARFGVLGVHVWQGSQERQVAMVGTPELVKAVKAAKK